MSHYLYLDPDNWIEYNTRPYNTKPYMFNNRESRRVDVSREEVRDEIAMRQQRDEVAAELTRKLSFVQILTIESFLFFGKTSRIFPP